MSAARHLQLVGQPWPTHRLPAAKHEQIALPSSCPPTQVLDVSPTCVKTSPIVLRFHQALRAGQDYQVRLMGLSHRRTK